MSIKRKRRFHAEVATSSLSDIMFFLLLFFLIISTMVTPATIRVLLPKSKTTDDAVIKKQINLAITADHKYFLDKTEISFSQIEPQLSKIMASKSKNEEALVLLQADKSLNLQEVIDVIDIGNKLDVKVVLFTKKSEK